jgi:hypothetical protein
VCLLLAGFGGAGSAGVVAAATFLKIEVGRAEVTLAEVTALTAHAWPVDDLISSRQVQPACNFQRLTLRSLDAQVTIKIPSEWCANRS